VVSGDGEAKFWIEPRIEMAMNYGFSGSELRRISALVAEHEQEIRDAWNEHFGS
jgi:hypothetical protein